MLRNGFYSTKHDFLYLAKTLSRKNSRQTLYAFQAVYKSNQNGLNFKTQLRQAAMACFGHYSLLVKSIRLPLVCGPFPSAISVRLNMWILQLFVPARDFFEFCA